MDRAFTAVLLYTCRPQQIFGLGLPVAERQPFENSGVVRPLGWRRYD